MYQYVQIQVLACILQCLGRFVANAVVCNDDNTTSTMTNSPIPCHHIQVLPASNTYPHLDHSWDIELVQLLMKAHRLLATWYRSQLCCCCVAAALLEWRERREKLARKHLLTFEYRFVCRITTTGIFGAVITTSQ